MIRLELHDSADGRGCTKAFTTPKTRGWQDRVRAYAAPITHKGMTYRIYESEVDGVTYSLKAPKCFLRTVGEVA